MTVFVYVNTAKQVGDKDHIKLFATVEAVERCFEENDSEGVAPSNMTSSSSRRDHFSAPLSHAQHSAPPLSVRDHRQSLDSAAARADLAPMARQIELWSSMSL